MYLSNYCLDYIAINHVSRILKLLEAGCFGEIDLLISRHGLHSLAVGYPSFNIT